MANSCWRPHQTPPPPPPPYEADQFCLHDPAQATSTPGLSTEDYAHPNQQTIPKTVHKIEIRNRMMPSGGHKLSRSTAEEGQHQVKKYNQDSANISHQQKVDNYHRKRSFSSSRSNDRNGNSEQFVRSLVGSRSFFNHISIEPLAFFAIVALYIEFPAVQDLIWTKICLEVIAEHPDFSQPAQLPNRSYDSNANQTAQPPDGSTSNLRAATDSSSPSGGRILDVSVRNITDQVITIREAHQIVSLRTHSHLICDRLNRKQVPSDIRQEMIDVDSLFWLKYQILICSLCLLASPYWGGLSDKIGRIIPMNVPIIAGIICNTILLVFGLLISLNSHSTFHVEWLYLGAVIVGLSGGQTVLIMNMFSFISDNTASEERSRRVIVLESVIFVAHALGFFLSKMIMLLGLSPPDKPWLNRHCVAFSVCILMNIFAVLYSIARLRHHKLHRFLNNFEREQQEAATLGLSSTEQLAGEGSSIQVINGRPMTDLIGCACGSSGERMRDLTSSTPDDPDGPIARSDKSDWNFRDAMITFRYYRETFEIATRPRDTRAIILLLLLSGFVSALSLAALMSLFFIYIKMDPFNWSTSQYSQWNSISSITRGVALISLTLMMKLYTGWNVPDPIVAAIGFLAKGAGLLTISLAQSASHLNWSLVAFAFSEFSMPPIRSLLSKLVVREELGKVYSCLGALQSFCFILGNIAFYLALNTYLNRNIFRLCFLVVSGVEFGEVILLLIIYTAIRKQMPQILS